MKVGLKSMSKYNWHMKYNGTNRYWVILNSEAFKDVGILETSYQLDGKERRVYILYYGHLSIGHFNTLKSAKQAFALRQYRKEKNKNGN